MDFAGINYLAVLVAGVAGWIVGAAYYMTLGKAWVAALGTTMEALKAENAGKSQAAKAAPFIVSILANLLMAFVLAGLIGHLGAGQATLANGVTSGAFVWAGFVLTTVTVNYMYAGRKPMLIAIDSGYWLLALLVQGAIIGALGA